MKTVLLLLLSLGAYFSVEGGYVDFDKMAEDYLQKKYPGLTSVDMSGMKLNIEDQIDYMNKKVQSEKVIQTITKTFESEGQNVFNESYNYNEVYTWTVNKGIKVKKSPSSKNQHLVGFISDLILSDEKGTTITEEQPKTLNKNAKITVPSDSRVTAKWVILEKVVEIPWKIKLSFEGQITVNVGGKMEKVDLKTMVLDGFEKKEAIGSNGIKTRAEGVLILKTAFSGELVLETAPSGGAQGRAAEEGQVNEEESTADDSDIEKKTGVAPFFRALTQNIIADLKPDSKYVPWLVVAGTLFEFLAGDKQSDIEWKEFGKAVKDVAVQIFKSEWGHTQWQKFKETIKGFFKKILPKRFRDKDSQK